MIKPIIETIDLFKLASGDKISLQVYKFIGKTPGKKAYIQSNLHGAEIVGNGVIYQLIDLLSNLEPKQLIGEIWLVPVCNPMAINQRNHFFATGRYNSYDGKDWNRIFWDYEKFCHDLEQFVKANLKVDILTIKENFLKQQKQSFAKQLELINKPSSIRLSEQYRYHLQSLSMDADYVIDIHSSSNQAIDYLYGFQGREESAKYFNLDYGILMKTYDGDAFDEAFMKPWLAVEKKFQEFGRDIHFDIESWTLELGSGMRMNPQSVTIGIEGIQNYLVKKEMLMIANFLPKITNIILFSRQNIKNYYAPTGGMIKHQLTLRTPIKAGEKLYQLLSFNKESNLPIMIDICAEADGFIFDICNNYSVNQGEYVLGILSV